MLGASAAVVSTAQDSTDKQLSYCTSARRYGLFVRSVLIFKLRMVKVESITFHELSTGHRFMLTV